MRYFSYWEPDGEGNAVETIKSEEEIKAIYYPFWKKMMDDHCVSTDDRSFESCLEDWIIVNWAEEIKDES